MVRDKAVESACIVIGLMQGGQQEVSEVERVLTNPLPDEPALYAKWRVRLAYDQVGCRPVFAYQYCERENCAYLRKR